MFGRSEDQTRGGADTSLENNNVYSVEPKVYVETAGERGRKCERPQQCVADISEQCVCIVPWHPASRVSKRWPRPFWPDCLTADRDQQSGPDVGTIATSAVAVTGAVALAVAGTATAKYWQVRCRCLPHDARCFSDAM